MQNKQHFRNSCYVFLQSESIVFKKVKGLFQIHNLFCHMEILVVRGLILSVFDGKDFFVGLKQIKDKR